MLSRPTMPGSRLGDVISGSPNEMQITSWTTWELGNNVQGKSRKKWNERMSLKTGMTF